MSQPYSQVRAMLAITRASLKATFRSPQSIFFSLFFPIVLIWIFGSLGGNGVSSSDVALEKNTDTTNALFYSLKNNRAIHFVDQKNRDIEQDLSKGKLAAIIDISENKDDKASNAKYQLHLRTSSASQRDFYQLKTAVEASISQLDKTMYPQRPSVATVSESMVEGREYKMIDFFLPGMIGFSLIGSAVFGIAFTIYSLKETLVLKRMYSTPIKRSYIILGESLAKVLFNLMTVVILITFGHYVYQFHLQNGFLTFINMILLSFIALLVFMGFGYLISALSKNQNVIPVYANLFMFPQYFLSGTFFPRTGLPAWLQPIIKFLPLTAVNDAMRNIAFEGASLASCWPQLVTLAVWGIIIYILTARFFRWE